MLEQNHPSLDKSLILVKNCKSNCLLCSIGLLFSRSSYFLCPSVVYHDPTLFGDQTRSCCQSDRKAQQDSQKQQDEIFLGHSEPFSCVLYGKVVQDSKRGASLILPSIHPSFSFSSSPACLYLPLNTLSSLHSPAAAACPHSHTVTHTQTRGRCPDWWRKG